MLVIAFGANAFAPLLPAYRQIADLNQTQVTFLLAIYVAGLIPALLIGGPLSDSRGRRALIRPALILSGIGSTVLALGAFGSFAVLSLGRLIVGIAVGLVMAAGAAWIQELSDGPAHIGARRATVFLSAGFGFGPLASGIVAEFLPRPDILPYLVHLILLSAIAPLAWRTEGGGPKGVHATAQPRSRFPRSVLSTRFLGAVACWAPWGFGTVTIAFATLTLLVEDEISRPVLYTGFISALTMLTGVFIQPVVTRFSTKSVPPAVLGLVLVVGGMLAAILVVTTRSPWAVIIAAVLLGAAYGILMVSGLHQVRLISPPEDLGAVNGVFYSLTYAGFFAPFVVSLITPITGYPLVFIIGALIAATSIVPVIRTANRHSSAD